MPSNIQRFRMAAFVRQQGRCYYCDAPMWIASSCGSRHLQCTAEHLVARCDGGHNRAENIVAACAYCNHTRHKRKRPQDAHAYRLHVQNRIRLGRWRQDAGLARPDTRVRAL